MTAFDPVDVIAKQEVEQLELLGSLMRDLDICPASRPIYIETCREVGGSSYRPDEDDGNDPTYRDPDRDTDDSDSDLETWKPGQGLDTFDFCAFQRSAYRIVLRFGRESSR